MKMKWRAYHIWIFIGICIFETLCVHSFDFEKLKSRSNREHSSKYHSLFEKPALNAAGDVDGIGIDIDALLETEMSSLNRLEKKIKNETLQTIKSDTNISGKIYNKKHLTHPSKSENKNHAKRENLLFRLFSDSYKPHKPRPIIKKKRDTNGFIRKLEIFSNDTNTYPSISQSVIPFSHFGRDRKINDDKICKTQIIKFFPKQMRKNFENKYENGSDMHKQFSFNGNNNEWELRQDIFVEEILPFREKNDFGFKDIFHDETKTIFDDILSIFTMLPFSFFDTVYVKLSTTNKSKPSTESFEVSTLQDLSSYEVTTYSDQVTRGKRQVSPVNFSKPISSHSELINSDSEVTTNLTDNTNTSDSIVTTNLTDNTNTSDSITTNKTIDTPNDKNMAIDTDVINNAARLETKSEEEKVQIDSTKSIVSNDILATVTADAILTANSNSTVSNSTVLEVSKSINKHIHKNTSETNKLTQPFTPVEISNTTDHSLITSVVDELSKQKLLNSKDEVKVDLLELQENDIDRYDEIPLKAAEPVEESEPQGSDKSAFLMVLGIIPGLIGLVIAVGVVGIWMIQKNSSWADRNNPGNEPTTSHSQAKPVLPCNI